MYGFHFVLSHRPERVREFLQRVHKLFEDFQADSPETADAQTVALSVLLHAIPAADEKFDENKEKT